MSTIPRIIHQTWKSADLPRDFRHWQKSWRDLHPDFEYRFWTNEDLEDLVETHFPDWRRLFWAYKENICRVDLARYLILKRHGGLYVDMDFECLRPHHKLLDGDLLFGTEPAEHADLVKAREAGIARIVCNAWMASAPGHPFWDHLLESLAAAASAGAKDVLDLTGPFVLSRAVSSYPGADLKVLPAETLYPVQKQACYRGDIQDLAFFEAATRSAYALHHWAGTWFRPQSDHPDLALPLAKVSVRRASGMRGRGLPEHEVATAVPDAVDAPLVSCLMVTRGDPLRVRRSIQSFLDQTYPNTELVIVTDAREEQMQLVRADYPQGNIRWVFVAPDSGLVLGQLRNLSIDEASGEYVLQWDDDDLFDPSRIFYQLQAIRKGRAQASVLLRWTVWWPAKRRLFISERRAWEGSLMCARTAMPRYPAMARGEDKPLVESLLREVDVVLIDAPRLYIYVIHGSNTWTLEHFEGISSRLTVDLGGDAYSRVLRELSRRVDVEHHLKPLSGLHRTDAATPSRRSDQDQGLEHPRVVVMTPMRDTKPYLDRYFELLDRLDYPSERLSLAILEGDSTDGTYEALSAKRFEHRDRYRTFDLLRFDTGFRLDVPRWDPRVQFARRSRLAEIRNRLLSECLGDNDWVLWLDADLVGSPASLLKDLLASGRDIAAPLCVRTDGKPFDLNTFILDPDKAESEDPAHLIDGLFQPPRGVGRAYLDTVEDGWVEVDGVGGAALLVRADVHRRGLIFPSWSYRGYIETEGLAMMAKDVGVKCWGNRSIVVVHADR